MLVALPLEDAFGDPYGELAVAPAQRGQAEAPAYCCPYRFVALDRRKQHARNLLTQYSDVVGMNYTPTATAYVRRAERLAFRDLGPPCARVSGCAHLREPPAMA